MNREFLKQFRWLRKAQSRGLMDGIHIDLCEAYWQIFRRVPRKMRQDRGLTIREYHFSPRGE